MNQIGGATRFVRDDYRQTEVHRFIYGKSPCFVRIGTHDKDVCRRIVARDVRLVDKTGEMYIDKPAVFDKRFHLGAQFPLADHHKVAIRPAQTPERLQQIEWSFFGHILAGIQYDQAGLRQSQISPQGFFASSFFGSRRRNLSLSTAYGVKTSFGSGTP